ncbi:hypothetical protein FUA23_15775 [Neolewinella aurantiaca]|uniref:PNPLA domain-containing protein n=1 Tax=Neolewinella aurantiaca TaxID=2602767 RepID=A0A5C7FFC6_9BACT|nr:hypothetical protein [Neolewinella aurantiaca]TXF88267.1 hypothetical protein FUA23_15775 [Neolewinella aurantiaca]
MRALLSGIHRSFSVQLFLLHLRSNSLLLLVWVLLALMMSGVLGPRLGLQYLFLDPEYLDSDGFWAYLIIGLAYGFFVMSWNLSTYLLIGGYFNFLASLSRPFFKYCINNALLPLGFFLFYCGLVVRFMQPVRDFHPGWWEIAESLSGLVLGLVISLFLYALYFNLTNRDISYYRPQFREPPPNIGPGQSRRGRGYRRTGARALAPKLMSIYDNPYLVKTYLNERLKYKVVRSVAHYDSSVLMSIFRQNHLNAILLQFSTIIVLGTLGFLIDVPFFQIPAGASFIVLLSLIIAFIGAISYWFSEWRFTLLVVLLFGLNLVTSSSWFHHGNQAYGLDYSSSAPYNDTRLLAQYESSVLENDLAATIGILENWKAKQTEEKPPFFVVCASGGGLAAALWAIHVVQTIETCSDGKLLQHTGLMTGASGGELGLAYLREAYLSDTAFSENGVSRLERMGQDLLNPVAFSLVSNDVFLPFTEVEVGGRKYRRDRAYGFERELNLNTQGWMDKPLVDYREPEQKADIPLLFVTPSIVEDGRRMVISPQGVSYMTVPAASQRGDLKLRPDMVDFRRLLPGQSSDSLRFTTALRMNATYPYVLPLVTLPTRPSIRLMDAGYRDNYGVASAERFLSVFRDWLRENTSGVHLIQVSVFRDSDKIDPDDRRGVVENLFSPVGVAGNILGTQILDQEVLLGQLSDLFGPDMFHLYRFNYEPHAEDPLETSVSLHMTEREQQQILLEVDSRKMQLEIDKVLSVLK